MFYLQQEKEGFYLSNDKTTGKYGPFRGVFCKNIWHGEILHTIDTSQYPAYKYAIGVSQKRIFVLEENGNLHILSQ